MQPPSVLVAGEALVDLFPAEGGATRDAGTFERRAGGAPANVAVAMARLGTTPWLWASLGDDGLGAFLRESLTGAGLPDRFLDLDPSRPTALSVVGDDGAGDGEAGGDGTGDPAFSLSLDGTAAAHLDAGRIPGDVLESVEWVHVGGVLLAVEPARTATLALAESAREAGCVVSFDPNTRPSVWPEESRLVETLDRALALSDVVLASPADFAVGGFPADPDRLARSILDRGPHTVFLTLGADGALALADPAAPWGRADVSHPGFEVDAVDPTGAGDAFTAATIAELVSGADDLAAVLAAGCATGALTTTATGATTALPDRDAVERFVAERRN